MPKRKSPAPPQVVVSKRSDDRWQAKKQGAERASTVTDTKKAAVDRGRELAKDSGAELVVKDEKGRIQSKDSHGRDPRESKG